MTGGWGGKVYASHLTIVYICPSESCREFFLGYYEKKNSLYAFVTCRPTEPAVPKFPEFVMKFSESYCDIYTECHKAEVFGLKQVSGTGYRRALEFLIKDYLISRRPDDRAEIENCPLGSCIETYVNDAHVKDVARRASWLGNEGTHYNQRWVEQDLRELKSVLQLVLRWIETEHLTEELLKTMPPAVSPPTAIALRLLEGPSSALDRSGVATASSGAPSYASP